MYYRAKFPLSIVIVWSSCLCSDTPSIPHHICQHFLNALTNINTIENILQNITLDLWRPIYLEPSTLLQLNSTLHVFIKLWKIPITSSSDCYSFLLQSIQLFLKDNEMYSVSFVTNFSTVLKILHSNLHNSSST